VDADRKNGRQLMPKISSRSRAVAAALAALTLPVCATSLRARQAADRVEPGTLPVRWTAADPACDRAAPFLVHLYTATFVIIRQSGCSNFEKPFLYLLLGSRQALLVDTGATGADPTAIVDQVLREQTPRGTSDPLPLAVVHSHGHGDHTAGDAAFRRRASTRVIDATPDALRDFFGIGRWPVDLGQYDLGDRVIDAIPIPGHQPASIALYDRRTGVLLTGDTLYPGRLYVRDAAAFTASVDRLVAFTASHPIAHLLGAHIENTRTPYLDYPEGTRFQPDEHALELGRAHLLELRDALTTMNGRLERRAYRDFTIWPVTP
jgi:hydroxyacylglutathione hydrolase